MTDNRRIRKYFRSFFFSYDESRLRIVRATRLPPSHRNSLFMMPTHCDLYPPPKRL